MSRTLGSLIYDGPVGHSGGSMASGTAAPHWHSTLTASAVDTVTMGSVWGAIQVINRSGGAEIYYTVDGSTPTVGGSTCRVLPSSICADSPAGASTTVAVVVKLISSGTPNYSVIGGL